MWLSDGLLCFQQNHWRKREGLPTNQKIRLLRLRKNVLSSMLQVFFWLCQQSGQCQRRDLAGSDSNESTDKHVGYILLQTWGGMRSLSIDHWNVRLLYGCIHSIFGVSHGSVYSVLQRKNLQYHPRLQFWAYWLTFVLILIMSMEVLKAPKTLLKILPQKALLSGKQSDKTRVTLAK